MNLLATNDIHSNLHPGLIARLWRGRQQGALLLDSGDFLEGSSFYRHFDGAPELRLLDALYHIVSPGNHGFHKLVSHDFQHARLLSTNIPTIPTSYLMEEGVGFLSILGEEAWSVIPERERQGHTFQPPAQAISEALPKLLGRCDTIVLLSHQGFLRDLELASEFPELDLILSGHCHSTHMEATQGSTRILKAHAHANSLLEVTTETHTIHPREASPLPEELAWLGGFLEEAARRDAQPLGHLHAPITRQEFPEHIARWVADTHPQDGLLIHNTCFRHALCAGPITHGDLNDALPFDSTLVRLTHVSPDVLNTHPLATHLHVFPGAHDVWWVSDYVATELLGRRDHDAEIPLRDLILR